MPWGTDVTAWVLSAVWLRRSLALVLLLSACGCVSVADFAAPAALQVIDAHNHLNGDMSAEELIGLMDRSGVRAMVLMARYYQSGKGSDEQAADYASRYPGRFIPFVAGQRGDLRRTVAWNNPSVVGERYLRAAEKMLKSGRYFGLGEYILVHYNYGKSLGSEVRIPVDSYLLRQISALGSRYSVPVLFHAEAEPDNVAQAEQLVASNRNTRFIWAHNCGRASAQQIGMLLERFANLMCDLGGMVVTPTWSGGYGHYWPIKTEWIHLVQKDGGELYPGMEALFERFPDRFMIGTDAADTLGLSLYAERIHAFRQLLLQLTPSAARKIGQENADRVFAGAFRGRQ